MGGDPDRDALKPLRKVSGWGPPPDVLDLAGWAAWRWAGRRAHFLTAGSPPSAVVGLPPGPGAAPAAGNAAGPVAEALRAQRAVLRVPPAGAVRDVLLAAIVAGGGRGALVLCATTARAGEVAHRLRRLSVPVALLPRDWAAARVGGAVVVGTRAAAWAPLPSVGAVVVLDAHDEAHQQESAPTWNAWEVAAERARRDDAPCVLVSPCPTLEQLAWGTLVTVPREQERAGWATLEVLDRRADDPRTGLYSPRLVGLLRGGGRVVCVLNRKGRARLLACARCHELAVCERCAGLVAQAENRLRCVVCTSERPALCAACGSTGLKTLRAGVTRVREELEALAGEPVAEITADTVTPAPDARVLVGTEAVLHRVDRADVVAFLEFDQELLAPRYRAAEQALALLARAARVVRGRSGRVVVQTRRPEDPVVLAAVRGDPGVLAERELEKRADLRFPPYAALAAVRGEGADAFVAAVRTASHAVEAIGPVDGQWLLRAADTTQLCDALAATPRPGARVRIEVGPLRI